MDYWLLDILVLVAMGGHSFGFSVIEWDSK